jgi:hypothetical protein
MFPLNIVFTRSEKSILRSRVVLDDSGPWLENAHRVLNYGYDYRHFESD